MKKTIFITSGLLLLFSAFCFSQKAHFSLSTDLALQHSFKKEQRYWSVGQTVQANFAFTAKDGISAFLSYYSNGKFNNNLDAVAKSFSTSPQQIHFVNKALMRYKHITVGWKHYLKGNFENEESWSMYGFAGLGLTMGRIENSHSVNIDTADYSVPVYKGKANFKRLTFDLCLGWERMLGGGIYFYNEARMEIPTTDYPSSYLFVNKNAPLMGTLNFGIRITFN